MSKTAADHHLEAAEHHEQAAKHHEQAKKYHQLGDQENEGFMLAPLSHTPNRR